MKLDRPSLQDLIRETEYLIEAYEEEGHSDAAIHLQKALKLLEEKESV